MRIQIIQFFFWIALVMFLFQCKDKTNPADVAPELSKIPNVKGEWILEWEEVTHKIQLDPDEKQVLFDGKEGLELDLDSVGIRIRAYDEESVKGYFLYSDIKSKSWVGTWENRVVRLIRRN